MEDKERMVLKKKNYIFIIAGCLVVILGFVLMAGPRARVRVVCIAHVLHVIFNEG